MLGAPTSPLYDVAISSLEERIDLRPSRCVLLSVVVVLEDIPDLATF